MTPYLWLERHYINNRWQYSGLSPIGQVLTDFALPPPPCPQDQFYQFLSQLHNLMGIFLGLLKQGEMMIGVATWAIYPAEYPASVDLPHLWVRAAAIPLPKV